MVSAAAAAGPPYDLVIRNGMVYDGFGGRPYPGEVAVKGDRIAYVGPARHSKGKTEIDAMRTLVRQSMEDGALGLTTALLYSPNGYAKTPELSALAEESAKCGGIYSAHMRDEGERIEAATGRVVRGRAAKIEGGACKASAAESRWAPT